MYHLSGNSKLVTGMAAVKNRVIVMFKLARESRHYISRNLTSTVVVYSDFCE
jgi:hypothetical protein